MQACSQSVVDVVAALSNQSPANSTIKVVFLGEGKGWLNRLGKGSKISPPCPPANPLSPPRLLPSLLLHLPSFGLPPHCRGSSATTRTRPTCDCETLSLIQPPYQVAFSCPPDYIFFISLLGHLTIRDPYDLHRLTHDRNRSHVRQSRRTHLLQPASASRTGRETRRADRCGPAKRQCRACARRRRWRFAIDGFDVNSHLRKMRDNG